METIVRIKILSDTLSPEEISRRLRREPDRSWNKGTADPKVSRNMSKFNAWILNSGLPKDVPIENQVAALLEKVQPVAREILEISATETVDFSCVVYSDAEPPIYFDNKTLSAITSLGANLDVDLYLQTQTHESSSG
jgi:Domain of unknown function (DUF4279)